MQNHPQSSLWSVRRVRAALGQIPSSHGVNGIPIHHQEHDGREIARIHHPAHGALPLNVNVGSQSLPSVKVHPIQVIIVEIVLIVHLGHPDLKNVELLSETILQERMFVIVIPTLEGVLIEALNDHEVLPTLVIERVEEALIEALVIRPRTKNDREVGDIMTLEDTAAHLPLHCLVFLVWTHADTTLRTTETKGQEDIRSILLVIKHRTHNIGMALPKMILIFLQILICSPRRS